MTITALRDLLVQWIGSLLIALVVVVAIWPAPGAYAAGDTKANSAATMPAAKISEQQATQAALQRLPGKVTDVTIEKKRGKNVYVIEVVADEDGQETDVLVDMETGAVLGLER